MLKIVSVIVMHNYLNTHDRKINIAEVGLAVGVEEEVFVWKEINTDL